MKLWLRRSFSRSLLTGLVLSTQLAASMIPNVGRFPQAVAQSPGQKTTKAAVVAPPKVAGMPNAPEAVVTQSNPEVEKLFDESFALYKALRWPKAPGAKSFNKISGAAELKIQETRFSSALRQIEISINAFKPSEKEAVPTLEQLFLVPQVLRNFVLVTLLLNPQTSKTELAAKYPKLGLSINKTALVDSTLRSLDANDKSVHPIKSLRRETKKIGEQEVIFLSIRPMDLDGIFIAHQVIMANNREDLLPLLKTLILKELLRQYGLSASYLKDVDAAKDLAPLSSKLTAAGIDVELHAAKKETSNLSKELAYVVLQEKALIPLDLSTDPDLKQLIAKAFTKLGQKTAGLDAESLKALIKESQDGFFEAVKEEQSASKILIASSINQVQIPVSTPEVYQKISDDLAATATEKTLLMYKDLKANLVEFGTAENAISDAELKALLDNLSAKLKKGYSAYFFAWLTKGAGTKNESNDLSRLIESLQAVAKTTTSIPDGPAIPGLLLQTKYLEMAQLQPRQRTLQPVIKKLAQQPSFEDARVEYILELKKLHDAAHPENKLGVGSTSDSKINDIVMKARLEDLKDWQALGKILGFDYPNLHPSLREWITFKTEKDFFNMRSKKALEDEVKRALLREALDLHPLLSLTAGSQDQDLLAVMVDPKTTHESLEKTVSIHLVKSRENLLKDIEGILNFRQISEVEDFLLNAHSFSNLVDTEMPELAVLFSQEKMQRRMLSPAALINKNIFRKFNRYLGSAYLATLALSAVRLVGMRVGVLQRILEPALLTANSQLNAFTWAFMAFMSADAVTSMGNYLKARNERKNVEQFFANSAFKNTLLSAADLENVKLREAGLKRYAIFTGTLNLFFIGIIIRSRVVQGRGQKVLTELERDQKAFDLLGIPQGNFDEAVIKRTLQSHLQRMGDGGGAAYRESAELLLSRIAKRETWSSSIFGWENGKSDETLMSIPSFTSLNTRERDIVDIVKLLWTAERLKPLIDQTARFSVRGAQ